MNTPLTRHQREAVKSLYDRAHERLGILAERIGAPLLSDRGRTVTLFEVTVLALIAATIMARLTGVL